MANQCTKFEVSSFSRSRDILGGLKISNKEHDYNHAPFIIIIIIKIVLKAHK